MKKEKLVALIVFFSSIVLSFSFFIFEDFFSQARSWGVLGLFLLNVISNASFFISAPTLFAVIAGGSLYNPFLVAAVSALGAGLGDTVSYLFGFSGRKVLNHKLSKKLWFRVMEDFFEKHGGWILFLFSLIPNPIFDSFGLIAGIFSYKYWRFLTIIVVGRFIRFLIFAYFGSNF